MLRFAVSKIAPVALRRQAAVARTYAPVCAPAAQTVFRSFATSKPPAEPEAELEEKVLTAEEQAAFDDEVSKLSEHELDQLMGEPDEFIEEGVVRAKVWDSLEWTLTSPPPVHQFDEPPIMVEISEV